MAEHASGGSGEHARAPEPELESGLIRLPRRFLGNVLTLLAVSVVPTGAMGGVHYSMKAVVEAAVAKVDLASAKLDQLLDRQARLENEFAKISGSGMQEHVQDLEGRMRSIENQLAATRAILERLERREGK